MRSILFPLFVAYVTADRPSFAEPTARELNKFDVNGFTPRPTMAAMRSDLRARQQQGFDPDLAICGYASGNPAVPFDCEARPCGYNTDANWFGCCNSYSFVGTSLTPLGCPIITSCVDYAKLSSCTGACASNTAILKCTNTLRPACGTAYLADHKLYNYNCVSTLFSINMLLEPTSTLAGAAGAAGVTSAARSSIAAVSSAASGAGLGGGAVGLASSRASTATGTGAAATVAGPVTSTVLGGGFLGSATTTTASTAGAVGLGARWVGVVAGGVAAMAGGI